MDCLLRLPEVRQLTGLSKTAIYDLMRRGEFPKQLRIILGRGRSVGWRSGDIQEFIHTRPPAHS
jgi:prophage regulatory protein